MKIATRNAHYKIMFRISRGTGRRAEPLSLMASGCERGGAAQPSDLAHDVAT